MNISDLEHEVDILQDKVNDLSWRMNAVCNFLTSHFEPFMDDEIKLYLCEEKNKSLADLHKYE